MRPRHRTTNTGVPSPRGTGTLLLIYPGTRKGSHEQACWESKPAPLPISFHQVIASPNYTISLGKGNYRTEACNRTATAVISGGKLRSKTRLGRRCWEGNHLQKSGGWGQHGSLAHMFAHACVLTAATGTLTARWKDELRSQAAAKHFGTAVC